MALNFGRAGGQAEVVVDRSRCTDCGLCVQVCKGAPLQMVDGRLVVDQSIMFGCIGCGQCMLVCPLECITIHGRDLVPDDLLPLPRMEERADYPALLALMRSRRSTRSFAEREIDPVVAAQILEAAATAPMGIPPSEVGVLALTNREAVQQFRKDLTKEMVKWRVWANPFVLGLMRPFIGRENYEMYRAFIRPAIDIYEAKDHLGEDWFLYDAPLLLYFYATPYADPADPVVAATQAMLAGQALALGTCMLGFPGYVMQSSSRLRREYGLPPKIQAGLAVIFGYPVFRYRQAVQRRFAQVTVRGTELEETEQQRTSTG